MSNENDLQSLKTLLILKEKELENFEKKMGEVETWREAKLSEQADTPLAEMPKLTVSMIHTKIGDLESEVCLMVFI